MTIYTNRPRADHPPDPVRHMSNLVSVVRTIAFYHGQQKGTVDPFNEETRGGFPLDNIYDDVIYASFRKGGKGGEIQMKKVCSEGEFVVDKINYNTFPPYNLVLIIN